MRFRCKQCEIVGGPSRGERNDPMDQSAFGDKSSGVQQGELVTSRVLGACLLGESFKKLKLPVKNSARSPQQELHLKTSPSLRRNKRIFVDNVPSDRVRRDFEPPQAPGPAIYSRGT